MNTKICSKCKENKPLDCFPKSKAKKDGYGYHCKECSRKNVQKHYQNNKQYYSDKAMKRSEELRYWLKELKSKLSCVKCEENHPACLEFHHNDPKEKEIEISTVVAAGWSKERILKEMEKCTVFCSNCHRKHHWDEKQKQ